MSEQLYYIQNKGYCGNSLRWWRIDGHGYTNNLDEAWKVPKEKADSIAACRKGEDIPWEVERADKLAERHVCQH